MILWYPQEPATLSIGLIVRQRKCAASGEGQKLLQTELRLATYHFAAVVKSEPAGEAERPVPAPFTPLPFLKEGS